MTEVVAGFYPIAEEKHLELKLYTEKLGDNLYLTDGNRIHQILSNLISNALKFTSKGYVKITGTIKKSKGKTDLIKFTVEDTGIGISNENSHFIFGEFTRISNDNSYEGSGLGLPITKRLVELLNGHIVLNSRIGIGSCFTVTLPLLKQSGKINILATINPVNKNGRDVSFNNEKVLLVDDDPFVLELTTHVLNETNLNVSSFSNVNDAMAAIEKEPFDLLITDVQMPGKNGFELISYFIEKQKKNPHAIAITGESNDKQHYSKAGFSAVVQKPFFPDELITVISGLLKNGETRMYPVKQRVVKTINGNYSIEGIKAFAEGEMDTIREILTSFTESTSQNLILFKKYLQSGNYEEIKKLAHKMLPMFRQLEATEIIEPLHVLEQNMDKINEDKCLELGYQLIIHIEFLMEKIIEDYQLPFSGKLIS